MPGFRRSEVCHHFLQAADRRVALRVPIRVALSCAEQGAQISLLCCVAFLRVVADEQNGLGRCIEFLANNRVTLGFFFGSRVGVKPLMNVLRQIAIVAVFVNQFLGLNAA